MYIGAALYQIRETVINCIAFNVLTRIFKSVHGIIGICMIQRMHTEKQYAEIARYTNIIYCN